MRPDSSPAAGETIGERLKRLRLDRGLSQRELAAPGVSYAYISRIEAGTRQPSVKALRRLAAKLGVSADYLETGSDLDAGGSARAAARPTSSSRSGSASGTASSGRCRRRSTRPSLPATAAAALRARVALATLAPGARRARRTQRSCSKRRCDGEPFAPRRTVRHLRESRPRLRRSPGGRSDAVELFERCMEASRSRRRRVDSKRATRRS